MAFTAADVKTLREQTGAGMMDCKKALTASEGDFEKAIEFLREKGLAAAAKKASRVAAEGVAYAMVCEKCGTGVVVEVNSETDFVAKNEIFQGFVKDVASVVMNENPADVEALKACTYPNSDINVEKALQEKVLTIGENLQIRRFERFDNSTMNVAYVHAGGKIGVLVGLEVSDNLRGNAAVVELGKDICMQIAAMNPAFLNRESVPADTMEKEKEIQLAIMDNDPKMANKPQQVKEKIVTGKLSKFYEENCLCEQAFVKDGDFSVEKYAEKIAKEQAGTIKIAKFVRFERGQGIEKKQENFAAEIAQLAGGAK